MNKVNIQNWQFIAHNSPRTIHRDTIHLQHNLSPAQFKTTNGTIHRSTIHRLHHEKIKIPLDEFLILLD
jgi:hypothetical protein